MRDGCRRLIITTALGIHIDKCEYQEGKLMNMKKIRSTLVLMSVMIAVFAAFIFSEKSTFATIDSGDMSKTLFEQLKSEVAGVSDGAVIDLPVGEYVFTEEINISGKKISFRNNG